MNDTTHVFSVLIVRVTTIFALGELSKSNCNLQMERGDEAALLTTHVGGSGREETLACRVATESTGALMYIDSGRETTRGAGFLSEYFLYVN